MGLSEDIRLGARDFTIERCPDGDILIGNSEPLEDYPERFTERLEYWAAVDPGRIFIAEREGDGWRSLSYGEVLAQVEAVAQGLLDMGLGPEHPLMILSHNSIDHAILALAAMHVGIPYAPVSTGYVTLSSDYQRLAHVVRTIGPGLVFVTDADAFGPALAMTLPKETAIAASFGTVAGREVVPIADLKRTVPTAAVAEAKARVSGDSVGKILFTSGSSALPKGVINTHRMLSSNQRMQGQAWRFVEDSPPIILEWAPWNHTLGSNSVFGLALFYGGTIYLDDGKITPDGIARTAENIALVRPTAFFGVPVVYQLLMPYLKEDARIRDAMFERLQILFYAGANLSDSLWRDLRAAMIAARGRPVLTVSALGATETGPTMTTCSWDAGQPGIVGMPVAGVRLKLTAAGDRLELRVKGPSITPGYWRDAEATAKAFDEDGWYRMGDAVRFVDENAPEKGLAYDGRLSENFKLATGTWVTVAPLREQVISSFAPLIGDAVIVGHSEFEVGALMFPILKRCRTLPGCGEAGSLEEMLALPAFREEIQGRLDALSAQGNSSTTRITRVVLIPEEPTGLELTDKQTLSYAAVLRQREADVVGLYRGEIAPRFFYSPAARPNAGT